MRSQFGCSFNRMPDRILLQFVFLMIATTTGIISAQSEATCIPDTTENSDVDASRSKKGTEKTDKKKENLFADAVKNLERVPGLFAFYQGTSDNRTLIEIRPDQFENDYLYSSKIDQAVGERNLYGTIMLDNFIFQWRRLGQRVQFIRKNIRFRAAPNSPAARAIENSFSDSVLMSGEILSEPNPENEAVLVDLREMFASQDFSQVAAKLQEAYKTPYSFDKEESGIVFLKSFPKNSEIGVLAHFSSEKKGDDSITLPSTQSLDLRIRYSLVALPEDAFMPRLGDDRIGHFYDMHLDYTSDKPDTLYVRFVTRWKLEKKEPSSSISEPKEPIVFWLENSIPSEYRKWIREGVLMWNPAFERLGFRNAIIVHQQPDGAEWDPADIRFNTIRWFVSYDRVFAIGPSHSDPYTGRKIDADISLAEGAFRVGARRNYELAVHPVQRLERIAAGRGAARDRTASDPEYCGLGSELLEAVALGYEISAVRPDWDAAMEERFLRQWTKWLVAHEVGHTLGLRHNFRASTVNGLEQLDNPERISEVGLAGSVMDYVPPILALPGSEQGDFFQEELGSYDHWAIEYAYKPIPGAETPQAELPELAKIASRAAEPTLAYATDEDAGLGPRALDPRNNVLDFTKEPLDWFEQRFQLIAELWSNMESKLLRKGESYEILRRAFELSWTEYRIASLVAMKYIGGVYHNRDHAGDPGGRLPYRPVPATQQQRALRFLQDKIWAPDAFDIPANLIHKLQFGRFLDFELRPFNAKRLDYPLHEIVLKIQAGAVNALYDPVKLSRLQDLELLQSDPSNRFLMADAFIGVRNALWAELDRPLSIGSFRRNLQAVHLENLIKLVTQRPKQMPRDAVALARADLIHLKTSTEMALHSDHLDYMTRAHLQDVRERIRQALEAQLEQQIAQE